MQAKKANETDSPVAKYISLRWKCFPDNITKSKDVNFFLLPSFPSLPPPFLVTAGSPYVKDINQPSLPTPCYSVLVFMSVFMDLPTVFLFHKSHPATLRFLTLFFQSCLCLVGPFNCTTLYESLPQPWCNPLGLTGPKSTNLLTNWLPLPPKQATKNHPKAQRFFVCVFFFLPQAEGQPAGLTLIVTHTQCVYTTWAQQAQLVHVVGSTYMLTPYTSGSLRSLYLWSTSM